MIEAFGSQWLEFERVPRVSGDDRKTCVWSVRSRSGVDLGTIAWYAPWRQYVLYPGPATVFNRGCLRDVAAFCEAFHKARVA